MESVSLGLSLHECEISYFRCSSFENASFSFVLQTPPPYPLPPTFVISSCLFFLPPYGEGFWHTSRASSNSIIPPLPPSPTPPRPHFLSARSQSSFSSSAWLSAIISSTPYNVLPSRLPISPSPLHILFIIHPPFLFFLAGLFFVFHLFLHLLFPLLFPYTERLHRQCFRYNPKRRRVLRSWPRILDVAYNCYNGSNGDQTSNFDFLTHFTNVKMSKQVEALAVALAYTRQKCLWTRETEPTFFEILDC